MVSAIIVTYNRKSFLKEAIDSVLAQSYFHKFPLDWELIIVDDGSTDGTSKLVEDYQLSQNNIHYYFLEHGGVSRARNFGIKKAKGKFIGFLDSDDLWLKDKIQIQLSYLKAFPQAKFCLTEEIWIRNNRRVNQGLKHKKYSGWILEKVLPLCLLSLSSSLFRRNLFEEIGPFDENFPVCEDYDLGLRIALRYPYHFIPAPLIIKRGGHPDQLSRKYWGMDRWRLLALEKALNGPIRPEQEKLIKMEIQRKCDILISGFLKRGNSQEAEYYLKLKEKYKLNKS